MNPNAEPHSIRLWSQYRICLCAHVCCNIPHFLQMIVLADIELPNSIYLLLQPWYDPSNSRRSRFSYILHGPTPLEAEAEVEGAEAEEGQEEDQVLGQAPGRLLGRGRVQAPIQQLSATLIQTQRLGMAPLQIQSQTRHPVVRALLAHRRQARVPISRSKTQQKMSVSKYKPCSTLSPLQPQSPV